MRFPCAARPVGLALLAVAFVGCERTGTAPLPDATRLPAVHADRRLIARESIPTYDQSGEVVHPDVVRTPPGVFAHPWHLVLTPFPFGAAGFENPSVYGSDDGVTWLPEPGAVNPVAVPGSGAELLSDPALVYVPETRELWLYYRAYTGDSDYVWLMRTSDAVHWSTPNLLFTTGSGHALSPSVVHRAAGEWQMWTVSGRCIGGTETHIEWRKSADGLVWSAPQAVPLAGLSPWHVFVRWVESLSVWVLVTNVKTNPGTCLTTDLYLAYSLDGVQWTSDPHPWLVAGGDSLGLFANVVYRSAFAEVGDSIRFWYSGAAARYRSYRCQRGQSVCTDSTMRWRGLGSEARLAADVLPQWLRHAR